MRSVEAAHSPAAKPLGFEAAPPLGAFLFAVACTALPVLAHSYPPLVDLPNHIARLHVAASLGGPLSQYYDYTLGFLPNSAADILWAWLPHSADPVRYAQLLMAFYPVALVSAAMVLGRVAHGRWSFWPATAGLLVYNANFFWGFQNYLLSVPFAVLALAIWLACEGRAPAERVAVFVPIALVLYFLHLFAFLILAVAVVGRELQLLLGAGRAWPSQLARGLVLGFSFVPPLAWHVYIALAAPPSALLVVPASLDGATTSFGGLLERAEMFLSPFIPIPFLGPVQTVAHLSPQTNWAGIGTLWFLGLCLLTLRRKSGPRLVLARPLLGPVIALAFAALLAPSWLNGVAFTHIRLPFVVIAVVLAGTVWTDLDTKRLWPLVMTAALLLVLRGVFLERLAAQHEAEMQDLAAVLEALPERSRLLPVRAPGHELDTRLWHIQAYAVVQRDAFVPTLFQGSHGLSVRPEWIAATHPALYPPDIRRLAMEVPEAADMRFAFLGGWADKFTHVLLLDQAGALTSAWPPPISRAGRFVLYRASDVAAGVEAVRP